MGSDAYWERLARARAEIKPGSRVRIGLAYRMGGRFEPDEATGITGTVRELRGDEAELEEDHGGGSFVNVGRLELLDLAKGAV